jgi:hypothetical protein
MLVKTRLSVSGAIASGSMGSWCRISGVVHVLSRLMLTYDWNNLDEPFGFGGEVRRAKALIGTHLQGKGWCKPAYCLYTRKIDFQSHRLSRQLQLLAA